MWYLSFCTCNNKCAVQCSAACDKTNVKYWHRKQSACRIHYHYQLCVKVTEGAGMQTTRLVCKTSIFVSHVQGMARQGPAYYSYRATAQVLSRTYWVLIVWRHHLAHTNNTSTDIQLFYDLAYFCHVAINIMDSIIIIKILLYEGIG